MSVSDSAAFIHASLSTASLRISRASVAPAPRTRAEQARPPLPSGRDRVWVPWVRRSVPWPKLRGVCAARGEGVPAGSAGAPREEVRARSGLLPGGPETPGRARCGPCRNPGSPEGGGRPQTLVSRGAARVRGRRGAWRGHRRLGCPEAGVPSRAGGGSPRPGPQVLGRGRGGPGTSQFAGRRREAQVCSAHQRGQSVSGSGKELATQKIGT